MGIPSLVTKRFSHYLSINLYLWGRIQRQERSAPQATNRGVGEELFSEAVNSFSPGQKTSYPALLIAKQPETFEHDVAPEQGFQVILENRDQRLLAIRGDLLINRLNSILCSEKPTTYNMRLPDSDQLAFIQRFVHYVNSVSADLHGTSYLRQRNVRHRRMRRLEEMLVFHNFCPPRFRFSLVFTTSNPAPT